ncbi:Hypothetical predicted protein [Octopus vulgaris]|uniref:Uncharacterized protein n=1 Tax=Octopus vulgaris TaxID=6645 RepID=A0AA36F6X9_OCTVU|nr:Hypothetical predicted protein [Octopus vulgaris]
MLPLLSFAKMLQDSLTAARFSHSCTIRVVVVVVVSSSSSSLPPLLPFTSYSLSGLGIIRDNQNNLISLDDSQRQMISQDKVIAHEKL